MPDAWYGSPTCARANQRAIDRSDQIKSEGERVALGVVNVFSAAPKIQATKRQRTKSARREMSEMQKDGGKRDIRNESTPWPE